MRCVPHVQSNLLYRRRSTLMLTRCTGRAEIFPERHIISISIMLYNTHVVFLIETLLCDGSRFFSVDPGKMIAFESSNPSRVVLIPCPEVIWSTSSSESLAPSYKDKG